MPSEKTSIWAKDNEGQHRSGAPYILDICRLYGLLSILNGWLVWVSQGGSKCGEEHTRGLSWPFPVSDLDLVLLFKK